MYTAKADPQRQRMDIVCDEALSGDDFERFLESIRLEARHLQSGWSAAVDFRSMWISDSFINERFQRLQTRLLELHAGKIGTLLDSDALKMRLWQSGTASGSNVLTRRFHDPAEWERFLAAS